MNTYDFEGWTLAKADLEEDLGRKLTDEQFEKIAKEIDGRIENFVEALFDDIIESIRKDGWLDKGFYG